MITARRTPYQNKTTQAMYRINYTGRPTLLSADEVIAKIASEQDVNVRLIVQNIEIAEERFVVPAIGSALYERLISVKNRKVTAANRTTLLAELNNQLEVPLAATDLPDGTYVNAIEFVTDAGLVALWERYLWRLAAEAVDFMCTVPTWLRHTATGQQNNNPKVIGGDNSGSATGDRGDVKFKMDVQREQRIDPLIAQMQKWICANQNAAMPGLELYEGCQCSDTVSRNGKVQNKGGWIFGAYEEDAGRHGYGCGCSRCTRRGGGW